MANKNNREHEAAVIKKVSRRQDSEGHGGAWKVAFADFVLALMCLFLVLWVLAARDQENLQQLLTGGGVMKAGGTRSIEHSGTPPRPDSARSHPRSAHHHHQGRLLAARQQQGG